MTNATHELRRRWFCHPSRGALIFLPILLGACAHDPGGYVAKRAAELREDPVPGVIRGYCASSCTMRLVRDCVDPAAHLVFHLPSTDTPHWRGVMARHYPAAIADWFIALPEGSGAYAMTGSEAAALGARSC
jgi:hypothetical protein